MQRVTETLKDIPAYSKIALAKSEFYYEPKPDDPKKWGKDAAAIEVALADSGIDPIFLLSPTSDDALAANIVKAGTTTGFEDWLRAVLADPHLAGDTTTLPDECFGELALPVARDTRDAHDLTRMHADRETGHRHLAPVAVDHQRLDLQHRLAPPTLGPLGRGELALGVTLTPHHLGGQLLRRSRRLGCSAGVPRRRRCRRRYPIRFAPRPRAPSRR